jgi:SAM-dependent methyltransferase
MSGAYFVYSGSELDALSGATNYYRWLIRRFSPYLGPRVVEVGAGIGTFSEFLLSVPQVEQLIAIEPAANTFPILERRLAGNPRARAIKGYLEDYPAESSSDSLVAVNVLEHVEDDDAFLRRAWDVVRPEGTLLLFVPAVPAIFGSLDRAFEHFRRYAKAQLRQRIERAGWTIERIGYMNLPGILTWTVAGKLLKRKSISARDARVYDRLVVPVAAAIEDRIEIPIGQSLLAIARKRARPAS